MSYTKNTIGIIMATHYVDIIGEKLTEFLHKSHLTQADFGKRIGLEAPVINRAANGKLRNPQYETIEAIARGMGMAPWQLLRPRQEELPIKEEPREFQQEAETGPKKRFIYDEILGRLERIEALIPNSARPLLAIWEQLDDIGREKLLFAARAIARNGATSTGQKGIQKKPNAG
jgi:transcriptional regulator with XRE-family HTH domain